MLQLNPPYATTSEAQYGPVRGSAPDWASSAFLDRGRQHTGPASPAELGGSGFQGWYTESQQTGQTRMRRAVDAPTSACYAEPIVQGAHSTYYTRRALPDDSPGTFRRSLRHVPPIVHDDRPTGKRAIPEPHGAPPRLVSHRTHQDQPSGHYAEPAMPRLSRPAGATILRESDQELSYERALGRKIRVGMDTYRGSGRAGDLSQSFAPPRRPEDDAVFFKSLKDSPTFTRFVASLPAKPAVGPHQRRAEELRRQRMTELAAERQLVETLDGKDDGDGHALPGAAA